MDNPAIYYPGLVQANVYYLNSAKVTQTLSVRDASACGSGSCFHLQQVYEELGLDVNRDFLGTNIPQSTGSD